MPNASQGTTALCPVLRETPITGRRWLETPDATDALNMTFASAPGTMYVARLTAEGVERLTETWGTTVNTVRQGRYDGGLIARSRDWSANEWALIERYFGRYAPGLGPELVVNGTFDISSAGWSATGSLLSVVGGELIQTLQADYGIFGDGFPSVVGKAYRISAVARRGTATGYNFIARSSYSAGNLVIRYGNEISNQSFVIDVTAPSEPLWVVGQGRGVNTHTVVWDNISAKEIL
jgi:hypothetical protein